MFHFYQRRVQLVKTVRSFSSANMTANDCYRALGIPFGSTEEQVKQAYRKLAKTHHPDLGGNSDKFILIQKAYDSLMDPSFKRSSQSGTSSSTGSSSSAGSSQYWRSWDTGSSWWSGNSSTYSSSRDFDAEFEEQWRNFTHSKRRERKSSFRARSGGFEEHNSRGSEDDEYPKGDWTKEESYKREKEEAREANESRRKGRGRKSQKSEPFDVPDKVRLSAEKEFADIIEGDFERVSKFNGRPCFNNRTANLFLFWSNKNRDWKIASILKDDGNCLAFNDRLHPSVDLPFILGDAGRWMVWSNKARRYLPAKILAQAMEEDYTQWTVDQLRQGLEERGLKDKVNNCYEKSELVELMKLFGHLKPQTANPSGTDTIPEGHYQLCSRQRHDGVVQAPPVLNERCKVGNNRVDKYCGPLEGIEEWLLKHGDRRRYYGVCDSDKNFCFGLIWKNNKSWARAGTHDW